jgi:hypothetical protein
MAGEFNDYEFEQQITQNEKLEWEKQQLNIENK